jgi:type I restriction enzyme S subunit
MELKKMDKQNRFMHIPEEWSIAKFKDISIMKGRIGWQGLNQTEFTFNSDEPFLITGMNFKDGEIRWNEVYHVPWERYEIAKEIQLKTDDVLMTKDGTIGKILYVSDIPYPGKATLNSHLLVFRPIYNSYIPKYLYYNLQSPFFLKHIELTKSGTTFFGVSQQSVGEYDLILPPLIEQKNIATSLSEVDLYISSLEKLIVKRKNIKQGTMQQLLKPQKGWVEVKLTDVLEYIHGKAHEQDIVEDGQFIVVNSKFVSTEGSVVKFSNSNYCPAKKNDLLMVLSDLPNGKALAKCFFVEENNKYAVNQRVCILRSKGADQRFLFYVLNRNKYFLALNDGVSQTHILNHHIEKCKIFLPLEIDKQIEIASILFDMNNEISALEKKLSKIILIKQGMMQNLLTGKIRLV